MDYTHTRMQEQTVIVCYAAVTLVFVPPVEKNSSSAPDMDSHTRMQEAVIGSCTYYRNPTLVVVVTAMIVVRIFG